MKREKRAGIFPKPLASSGSVPANVVRCWLFRRGRPRDPNGFLRAVRKTAREAFKLQANTHPDLTFPPAARPPRALTLRPLYVFARDFNFNASRAARHTAPASRYRCLHFNLPEERPLCIVLPSSLPCSHLPSFPLPLALPRSSPPILAFSFLARVSLRATRHKGEKKVKRSGRGKEKHGRKDKKKKEGAGEGEFRGRTSPRATRAN